MDNITSPQRAPGDVLRMAQLMVPLRQVVEVRALNVRVSDDFKCTYSGYFDNPEAMATAVMKLPECKGVYVTLNPVVPELLARCSNRMQKAVGDLTKDNNILRRNRILLDFDPVRPSGISATDQEKQQASDRSEKVYAYLRDLGWPDPIAGDSGNGFHLIYLIDLPTQDDDLVRRCLQSLAAKFDDAAVTVDSTVHNASRITKVYGTVAAKGDSLQDRPHRVARLLRVPEPLEVVPLDRLRALAADMPQPKLGARGTSRVKTIKHLTADDDSPPNSIHMNPVEDIAKARECLKELDPGMNRAEWIKVGMALHSVSDELFQDFDRWSSGWSGYKAGEPLAQWRSFHRDRANGCGLGSLIHMARQSGGKVGSRLSPPVTPGPVHEPESPMSDSARPEVILPVNGASLNRAAAQLGLMLAATGRLYNRGGVLVTLTHDEHGGDPLLESVGNGTLPSLFESVASLKIIAGKGQRSGNCSESIAKLIRLATPFLELFPVIKLLSICPVLTERDGRLVTVTGYDQISGIMAGGAPPLEMSAEEGATTLREALGGFRFATDGDHARALAALITPALVWGQLLPGRAPLDLGEADASQAGKGFRNKICCAIYGQSVRTVTQRKGGVGGLEESFDHHLVSGANFICLDNLRGRIDLPALESFMTEDTYSARVPYQRHMKIDATRVILQLTSNKADLTVDLANRASCVRILKQPAGHEFLSYSEGSILDHVRANQPCFLGAVFALIRAWHKAGKPKTRETRHDFRGWVQTLDWICQNLLETVPIMDGHRETQTRMSTPALNFLREVAQAVRRAGELDRPIRTNELVEIALREGCIDLPGLQAGADICDEAVRTKVLTGVGNQLRRCFQTSAEVEIDGMVVTRHDEWDEVHRRQARAYAFSAVPTSGRTAGADQARDPAKKADRQVELVRDKSPSSSLACSHASAAPAGRWSTGADGNLPYERELGRDGGQSAPTAPALLNGFTLNVNLQTNGYSIEESDGGAGAVGASGAVCTVSCSDPTTVHWDSEVP